MVNMRVAGIILNPFPPYIHLVRAGELGKLELTQSSHWSEVGSCEVVRSAGGYAFAADGDVFLGRTEAL
jgi:hypothetical protein